jgi:hypothetical protein
MPELFPINDADKLACVEREIRKRLQVYPRLVEAKKLSEERAEREIAVMEAIRDDYREKARTR